MIWLKIRDRKCLDPHLFFKNPNFNYTFPTIELTKKGKFGCLKLYLSNQGPRKHPKSVGSEALKLTPKYLKFAFYCIFSLQFSKAVGSTDPTAQWDIFLLRGGNLSFRIISFQIFYNDVRWILIQFSHFSTIFKRFIQFENFWSTFI